MNFKRYHVSKNLYNTAETDWTVGILDDNGQPTGSTSSHYTTNFTEVSPQSIYCLSGTIITTGTFRVYFYDGEKNWISRTAQKYSGDFTTPSNCYYIRIQVTANISSTADWMLNTGSEALPYEPYGDTWHDIPHYIHNTSTDTITTLPAIIYPNDTSVTVEITGNTGGVGDLVESGEHAGEYIIPIINNGVTTNIYNATALDISDNLTTTIPTIAGANTLSIGTTLQPSEVSVNYKGWHPVQSVHERESGQWD